MKRQAGMTLLEVLIAVTLLSVLSAGMMMAMRIGLSALSRTDSRLMDNRRIAGAQRILEQELQGVIPVVSPCGSGGPGGPMVSLFSGQPTGLTTVTAFSLQGAWRGRPQVIQLFTGPDDNGGMRLLVNESPYTGPENAGKVCTGTSGTLANFLIPSAGPTTFVLADHLREVRFQYLHMAEKVEDPGIWTTDWKEAGWPFGVRVLIVPMEPSPARLQPISVTVPIYLNRDPGVKYVGE
jgi:prepilin-type N-terminal cleavage/methylation domain-containing protein